MMDKTALHELQSLLSYDERARMHGFKMQAAQDRFVLGRVLLRSVLSYYAPVEPREWRIAIDGNGFPSVDRTWRSGSPAFNLSHSGDVVALAVTAGHSVGIDVEAAQPGVDMVGIARIVFCASEIDQWMSRADADGRTDAFVRIWTLKEAFVKACGLGFSIPLRSFAFDLDSGPPRLISSSVPSELGQAWEFWQGHVPPGYILAIATPAQAAPLCVSIRAWSQGLELDHHLEVELDHHLEVEEPIKRYPRTCR